MDMKLWNILNPAMGRVPHYITDFTTYILSAHVVTTCNPFYHIAPHVNSFISWHHMLVLSPHGTTCQALSLPPSTISHVTSIIITIITLVSPPSSSHYCHLSSSSYCHHHHHHLRVVLSLLSFLWQNPSLDSFHWCLSWANLVQVILQVPTELISPSCFRSSSWS